MGFYDSSKTRVRPIVGALEKSDSSGKSWLGALLRLGGRGTPPDDPGTLKQVLFEFPAPPPSSFLRWLIEHPIELSLPAYKTSDATRSMREKLLAGDPVARAEALEALTSGASHRGKWWCFEGTTMVDCALFTDSCVVFVEGKRTEVGASQKVSWYPHRNQVLRNLDCARALAAADGRDYYAMLIIEEAPAGDPRLEAAYRVVDPTVIDKSLPHLSKADRGEALEQYLGFTTWQQVVRTFDLAPELLSGETGSS